MNLKNFIERCRQVFRNLRDNPAPISDPFTKCGHCGNVSATMVNGCCSLCGGTKR